MYPYMYGYTCIDVQIWVCIFEYAGVCAGMGVQVWVCASMGVQVWVCAGMGVHVKSRGWDVQGADIWTL